MDRMSKLCQQIFTAYRQHYIELMLVATRVCGSTGGVLVVYYVHLTMQLVEPLRTHFIVSAGLVVILACCLALCAAMWETRNLRRVLRMLSQGERPDAALAQRAGSEAVIFPARHHRTEAWLVPCSTLIPVCIVLRLMDGAPLSVLLNITMAVFMGIGLSLMSTFFIIERLMQPVVLYLLDEGIEIDYSRLPANRLRFRLNLCFGLVILITALMIGTMAKQRAADIINNRHDQNAAVASLQAHTTYITVAAIVTGLVFSTVISQTVASRVAHLVQAMKKVEAGNFSHQLRATGNDEIDILTRQFNSMVQQLARHDATIHDLNANLERKVEARTLSMRLLHAELDQRNNELETALTDLRKMQSQLVDVAHRAGMTEIAAGVLHNVGNVLNSVNVSITVLDENLRKSKIGSVRKVATLINECKASSSDDRLHKLPGYLEMLADSLEAERDVRSSEVANLAEKVQHIKNIISAQQNYTRRVTFKEPADLSGLIRDLIALHEASFSQHHIQVTFDDHPVPILSIEKSKLLQVLDNLIKNAVEAMEITDRDEHHLTVRLVEEEGDAVISVMDTGHGITSETMPNIFRFGFTNKTNGNGFGLHSAAIAMGEMGGTIRVESPGQDGGATFTITLPLKPAATAQTNQEPLLAVAH